MTPQEMAKLSRAQLLDLVCQQAAQMAELAAEVAALRAENAELRQAMAESRPLALNSRNSSQPPSQDQKGNLAADRERRPQGPPRGHRPHVRPRVAEPDQVLEVKPQICGVCQAALSPTTAELLAVNQITELPAAPAEVIEVRQYSVVCPGCAHRQVGVPPAGLEMTRQFGARLEATVVYYRQEQHLSYIRTQAALWHLHGVHISQGGIDKIMQRARRKACQHMAVMQNDLQQSAVIYSDETSCRVNGQNWWQWVFCSKSAIVHVIRFNRSADVIQDLMGHHQAEVWVSDCWSPQLKAPARQRQLCLAHQLRNLQAVVDRHPTAFWPQAMQVVFRSAIHLHQQRSQLAPEQYRAQVVRLERLLDQLLKRNLSQPRAAKLQRRYRKYRDAVFVFLYRSDVNPTNNLSEQHLRPAVIHRKVTGGFRSEWGAQGYAALKSVTDTAALTDRNPFETIQQLFAPPVLPLPG